MDRLTPENAKSVVRDIARQRIKDVPWLVTATWDGWELEEPFTHIRYFAKFDWAKEDFVIVRDVLMDHRKIEPRPQDDD